MYLGIDIGGTSIKYGLVDNMLNVIKKYEHKATYLSKELSLLDDAVIGTDEFINLEKINLSDIKGIGISATGQISSDGKVIGAAGHIPKWIGVDIRNTFETKYGIKTVVINDANAMVVAEKNIGAGKNFKNIVGITIGTGVGGGIIVNDELLVGADGIAGEIGHILINKCAIIDSYNREGSYEDAASTGYLVKQVEKLGYSSVDGRKIFNELMDNDDVRSEYNCWIDNITRGLVSLVHIFNPGIVIIGGGVSARHEFIDLVKDRLLKSVMPGFSVNLKVVPAKLGNDAGLIGAVSNFMDGNNGLC